MSGKTYSWPPRDPHPGHETYLFDRIALEGSHTLQVAREHGAWATLAMALKEMKPEEVTAVVKDSGLRGRGGAGFPCGLKWTFMPRFDDPRPRFLAVNADESEPGTCKDRILIREDPHLLLEGTLLACYAMQCRAAYVFIRGEYVNEALVLQEAIGEAYAAGLIGRDILGSGFSCDVHLTRGAGAYICGEETALMEAQEGKRGHPRPKPPFPAQNGLWGRPTTVNNVETLCNVPAIVGRGAAWYRGLGTQASAGNVLVGISGHVERPGVYEVPLGMTLRELVMGEAYGGGIPGGRALQAIVPGGSSAGFLPPEALDVPLTHDDLKAQGSMLGTASIIVLDETADLVRATRVVTEFYADESCGQCSQCREGTAWLAEILRRIEGGEAEPDDIPTMLELCEQMKGKTICVLSDACAWPIELAIKHFRPAFEPGRAATAAAGEAR
ncbi:MAG: NADH-quinone oxidoreductase subunit NuoF [Planctomycetota bacterium]